MCRFPFSLAGLLAVILGGGFEARAVEGVVRTAAGATLKGEVTWTAKGLSIAPTAGDPVVVPVEQVAEFTGVEPPVPAPVSGGTNGAVAAAPGAPATAAPGGWNQVAIGPGSGGRMIPDNGGLLVSGAGGGLRGNSDNFFLAEKRMNVSGQIVGALTAFGGTNAESMAGLTLRDNLGESAAYAFLGQRSRSGVCFQYRQIAGGMTMRVTNAVMKFPAWFRLSRMGGSVVAEVSSDGRQWQAFGQANVNLGQNVRAGMAVCSGVDEVRVGASFQEPTVGASGLGYAPASGYPRVLLRGGSILIAPVASADDSVVRLGGSFSGALVSMLNVARIEFVPTTPELEARLESDRPGLVLTDGDFLEGTVRSVATNVVTMSSLLLGFRRFPAGSEAATIQVGALTPEEAPYRVRTRNGSELRARRIEAVPSGLRVESPLLGSLTLRSEEIASVRRGPAPQ
jgi:hypothetical protein